MDDNKLALAFSQMAEAIRGLGSIMRAATPGRKKSGKTRRGAKHKIGQVFKARKKFSGTPAEYRRQHRGVVTIVPDYKKKHAAPRWRNRWISS